MSSQASANATDLICHNCGTDKTRTFYRVENVPVHSCLLLDSREEAKAYPRGDIELALCEKCGFIQNALFDSSVHEYSPRYEETQSFSPRFNQFAREIAEDYAERFALQGKTVLEIGCGKGEFLVGLCEVADCDGIGIDPGYRPERTADAAKKRVEFHVDFYSEKYRDLSADLVLCRHTLEHIEPTREFMQMVRTAIGDRDDVFLSFELPDTERILEEHAFWDIYYEHCSYFTDDSLRYVFESCGFETIEQRRLFNGQYWIHDAKPGPGREPEIDGQKWLDLVEQFENGIPDKIQNWRKFLASARSRGETVALWGSGSKAVAFMTTLGIEDEIAAVTDVNPHRHGKFMPGTGHEIVPPSDLMKIRPDIVVAMNPIYLGEIGDDLRAMGLDPELTAV